MGSPRTRPAAARDQGPAQGHKLASLQDSPKRPAGRIDAPICGWLIMALLLYIQWALSPQFAHAAPALDTTIVLHSNQQLFWYGRELRSPIRFLVQDSSLIANGYPNVDPNAAYRDSVYGARAVRKYPFAHDLAWHGADPKSARDSLNAAFNRTISAVAREVVSSGLHGAALNEHLASVVDARIIDTTKEITFDGGMLTWTERGFAEPSRIGISGLLHARSHTALEASPSVPQLPCLYRCREFLSELKAPGPWIIFVQPRGMVTLRGEPGYSDALLDLQDIRLHREHGLRALPQSTADVVRLRQERP